MDTVLNATLRKVPLFAKLKDDELRFLEQGEELWLSPGEEFITEGQPAENFYVLLEGQVRLTKKVAENKEISVGSYVPGTFFRRSTNIARYSIPGDYAHSASKPFV